MTTIDDIKKAFISGSFLDLQRLLIGADIKSYYSVIDNITGEREIHAEINKSLHLTANKNQLIIKGRTFDESGNGYTDTIIETIN